jgi:hypothetical protein
LTAETLDRSKVNADLLIRNDLDPARLADSLMLEARDRTAELSPAHAELFRRVIQEAGQSIVDMAHQLPNFSERTLGELLRGNRVLLEAASRTLEGLERIRSESKMDQEIEGAKFEDRVPASCRI